MHPEVNRPEYFHDATIFRCGVLCLGIIATYLSRRELVLAWRSRKWPSTEGRISEKSMRFHAGTGIAGDGTSAPIARRWREIETIYSYKVGKVIYKSALPDFSGFGWERQKYYHEGEKVIVYYCPERPELAVLHPGIRLSLLFGPILLLAAPVLFIYYR